MPQRQEAPAEIMQSVEARLISQELRQIRNDQAGQADTLRSISQSLQALTRVEINQQSLLAELQSTRAGLEKHGTRLDEIDRVMPGLIEMRRWVIAGVLGCMGLVGVAMVKLVISAPYIWPHPPTVPVPPPAVATQPREKP